MAYHPKPIGQPKARGVKLWLSTNNLIRLLFSETIQDKDVVTLEALEYEVFAMGPGQAIIFSSCGVTRPGNLLFFLVYVTK